MIGKRKVVITTCWPGRTLKVSFHPRISDSFMGRFYGSFQDQIFKKLRSGRMFFFIEEIEMSRNALWLQKGKEVSWRNLEPRLKKILRSVLGWRLEINEVKVVGEISREI